jgi:hypothetical protein
LWIARRYGHGGATAVNALAKALTGIAAEVTA